MKIRGFIAALSVLTLAASFSAQAQVKIGVITSATGPAAFVGIPQKNAVAMLPKKIGDTTIEYIYFDDASDPTQSVTLAKKLLTEDKIDALIGPSGSPNAMGVLQVMAEAQTPMLAPVGTSAVVLPMDAKKRWVFKTQPQDEVISQGLVGAMLKRGVKTIGFIGRNDPYGQGWYKTFTPMAEKAGMKIVANESYNSRDTSVTGQVLKLMEAKPDAVLVAGVAADAALPQIQLVNSGYKGQIYHTHGSATSDFIKIGGKQAEGALVVGPMLLVPEQAPDSVPTKKVALEFVTGYARLYGARPPIFAAGVYDAGVLLQHAVPEALKKGKPGTQAFRTALRDALEGTKDLPTSQGIVTMTPQDHAGFDASGRVLLTIKGGEWLLVKD